MKKGDYIRTPRFCTVQIAKTCRSLASARKQGFVEPTHYKDTMYEVYGKNIGTNRMIFAGVKKI